MTHPAATRHSTRRSSAARRAQHGAALLLAMLIVTLVATLAAGMVWQQWRAIEVEAAERSRSQSAWLLAGALDWARLILREDARDGGPDGLTEPWATGLEEIRLSTFLAADKNNTDDTTLDAFLSGQITDAQSRYNLRNLVNDNEEARQKELRMLVRLCQQLGLPAAVAQRISDGMNGANQAENKLGDREQADANAALRPQRVSQLSWLGLDAATIATLTPFVTILPQHTPVNLNTAPPEVLVAVVEGMDRSSALRLVQQRAQLKKGFERNEDVKTFFGGKLDFPTTDSNVTSQHFEVTGQLRYEDNVLRQRSLVQRRQMELRVLWTERLSE